MPWWVALHFLWPFGCGVEALTFWSPDGKSSNEFTVALCRGSLTLNRVLLLQDLFVDFAAIFVRILVSDLAFCKASLLCSS